MKFSFATVFSPSSSFSFQYVKVMSNVLQKYHPNIPIYCFSDYTDQPFPKNIKQIPLKYPWAKDWWTKLLLFQPDIEENLFYIDLDNLIIRSLEPLFEKLSEDQPLMIKDLDPSKERFQSAVMWIPHSKKHLVWNPFIKMPNEFIKEAGKFGDAAIIRKWWNREKGTCETFQKIYGDEHIISFRFHWGKNKYKDKAKVICFHGKNGKPHKIDNQLTKEHFFKYQK